MVVASGEAEQIPTVSLRAGAVSLYGDWVAAVTNVAPSAGVALTLGALLGACGRASPFIIVVVGLAMLFIGFAYDRMNLWQPTVAAQTMWLGRTVSPVLGYASGFVLICMSLTANIGNSSLIGPYFLGIVWPSQANNRVLEWLSTAVLVAIVAAIAIYGIRAAIRFQSYIVWVEYTIIFIFAIYALHAEFTHMAGTSIPSWSWLWPSSNTGGFSGIMSAIVIGVFTYGGWECPVYLGEEQKSAHVDPGRGAILSVIFCIIWYTFLIMAVQGIASTSVLINNSGNLFAFSAHKVMPHPWDIFVSLAVLSSVVAVVQAQMNNGSRMAFGLAREKLFPRIFATVSPETRTPWVGLLVAAAIPVLLLIIYLANSNVGSVIANISSTAGFLYIVLYVVTAVACIWYYRGTLSRGGQQLLFAAVLPGIGGLVLLIAFFYAIVPPHTANGVIYPTVIMIVGSVVVAYIVKALVHAPFFSLPRVQATDDVGTGQELAPGAPVIPPPAPDGAPPA